MFIVLLDLLQAKLYSIILCVAYNMYYKFLLFYISIILSYEVLTFIQKLILGQIIYCKTSYNII